jgi:hypothetical protein
MGSSASVMVARAVRRSSSHSSTRTAPRDAHQGAGVARLALVLDALGELAKDGVLARRRATAVELVEAHVHLVVGGQKHVVGGRADDLPRVPEGIDVEVALLAQVHAAFAARTPRDHPHAARW